MNITSKVKALYIAEIVQAKKAEDVIIMDMRKLSGMTDYFVICSGNNARQINAITDYVLYQLKQAGQKVGHIEGQQHALWVLLDCGDVVVHIFTSAVRRFYDLEHLWAKATRVKVKEALREK